MPKRVIKKTATCVGCGCTDDKGCPVNDEGYSCTWLEVNYDAGVGICCRCVTRENSDKFKKAVNENFISKMDQALEGGVKSLGVNRREFLSAEKRREGRVE